MGGDRPKAPNFEQRLLIQRTFRDLMEYLNRVYIPKSGV